MRTLNRNKRAFYYALYSGKTPVVDANGHTTGEYVVTYGNPLKSSANISAAKGETQTRQFGENEIYDKVIVADNSFPPIDEYSVLWIDTVPSLNQDGTLRTDVIGKVITPFDYVVKKIARSMNSVSVAVSKVKVQ